MERVNLSVSYFLNNSWEIAKKHGLLYSVFVLIIILINYGLSYTYSLPDDQMAEAVVNNDYALLLELIGDSCLNPMFWISEIIYLFLIIVWFRSLFLIVKGESDKIEFSALKLPVIAYVKIMVVYIIVQLISLLGFFACVIPGIFICVRLLFSFCYIVDNPNVGIVEAISASWNMTKGNFWSLLKFGIVALLIYLSGFLCCCIGFFFTYVVVDIMLILLYLNLKERSLN